MQKVVYKDLGRMEYQAAWDYQESLLQENVRIKTEARQRAAEFVAEEDGGTVGRPGLVQTGSADGRPGVGAETTHYLLFVEHPPVYTLGKSGHMENVLIGAGQMEERGVQFFRSNRGGDITFHGPGQLVGYPILDLERFYTDIGRYLRNLEEVGIRVLADYGIAGGRSSGETGVWIGPDEKGKARKICAIGVRCSRWVTMHGFAFNVSTDLTYFGDIIPCGIADKEATSLEKELGRRVDLEEVKESWKKHFEEVFEAELV
ncbi:MAG: lipoyl(octanoyl) transferase LipB [Bacteroidetes bacterium]|nr:lipoyl(octanoyl) transferase LipB [Bacteroidota bacterium]